MGHEVGENDLAQRLLIAGNWKMNGLASHLNEGRAISEGSRAFAPQLDLLLCPPATLVRTLRDQLDDHVFVGGQTCHHAEKGAHTGEVSAEMLRDAGASHVIVGHSERRADHGESSESVRSKLTAAHRAGLIAVVCIGETLSERETGKTLGVLETQLAGSLHDDVSADDTIVAYEPVWAIGTGKTPSTDDVAQVHAHLRGKLIERFGEDRGRAIRLLYGGSVQPANAATLLAVPDVDGALVGGASLKASDFLAICEAACNCR
ncbi:triose-phosphate isomerase [Aureimonas sp. AU40]|uniref:triose-phosphate isomerase n=1 Tax=Aureimonas sp. AU40 TaxID=1637747 RepID=UPI000786571B|nr:triose-phosphate isomerase [Aureimonas sp. AU40]